MKRLTGRIAALLLILTLLLSMALPVSAGGEKKQAPRAIAIVFDNSYSMYMNGQKAWCRATYAMEVFASMLNDGDTLMIYPMHPITLDGKQYSQENPLTITDPAQASQIRRIYTDDPQGTPVECLDAAAAGLRRANVDSKNKWLIILTDGEQFYQNDEELSKGQTSDVLGENINGYVGDMNVQYLGIKTTGDPATPKNPPKRGYYERVAENSEDVLAFLTGMCNQIFGRDTLPAARNSSGRLSFDISMKKLIVFVQGVDVSDVRVSGASGEAGTKLSSSQVRYAENGAGDRAEGRCVSDTALQGMLVTYTDCPAGDYTVSYSGDASSIEVYYEPDADLDFVFTNESGVAVDPDEALYEGSYKVSYGIKDAKTGKLIDSDLLGEPVYDGFYSLNGKDSPDTTPIQKTGMSGEEPVSLKIGNVFYAKMTVTYLNGYTITKDSVDFGWPELGLPVVEMPPEALELRITPPAETAFQLPTLEDGAPYTAEVFYGGKKLEGSELQNVELKWDPDTSNAEILKTLSGDHYDLTLHYKNPADPASTVCGDCTVSVYAFYTAPGCAEATAESSMTYSIEDPTGGLSVRLSAPQDYFVIAELEDSESLRADITKDGEKLPDSLLDSSRFRLDVDCGGLEYEASLIPGESAFAVKLLPTEGVEAGKYTVTATATLADEIGRESVASGKTTVELSTIPEWLRALLIAIPILLLLLLLAYLLFVFPVMPKTVGYSKNNTDFTIGGDEIGGSAKISNGKKYGRSLSIEPPKTSNYTYSFSTRLQMKPMDPITKPSSKRRVKIEESSILNAVPADVSELVIGSAKFVRDEETRRVTRKGSKPGAKKSGEYIEVRNGSVIKMTGTARDRKNKRQDASFSTKLQFK